MNIKNFYLLIMALMLGCVPFKELPKKFLGTSIVHLEEHRDKAIVKSFNASPDRCYEMVLAVARNHPQRPVLQKHYELFQANPERRYIIFYDIPDQIDTTEVAVFFASEEMGCRVDVVSLSSLAKEKVAKVVFEELNANFKFFLKKLLTISIVSVNL